MSDEDISVAELRGYPGVELPTVHLTTGASEVDEVVFSSRERFLAFVPSGSPVLRVWDLATRRTHLHVDQVQVKRLVFSLDDTKLATYDSEKVVVWDVATGSLICTHCFAGEAALSGWDEHLAFNVDASRLHIIASSRFLTIDARTGERINEGRYAGSPVVFLGLIGLPNSPQVCFTVESHDLHRFCIADLFTGIIQTTIDLRSD